MRNIFKVMNVHLLSTTCKFIEDLANIGAAANSVVNPFIYSFLSTQFRQKLGTILERKIRRNMSNGNFLAVNSQAPVLPRTVFSVKRLT